MWLRLAAINGFLAVAAGAFAAHALRERLTVADLTVFETGARYHMYHALALFGVAVLWRSSRSLTIPIAGWTFTVGIVLFSGSLYALALTGQRWLGMVTPFGGSLLAIAWLVLAIGAVRPRRRLRF